jgi:hypothetical protein
MYKLFIVTGIVFRGRRTLFAPQDFKFFGVLTDVSAFTSKIENS